MVEVMQVWTWIILLSDERTVENVFSYGFCSKITHLLKCITSSTNCYTACLALFIKKAIFSIISVKIYKSLIN